MSIQKAEIRPMSREARIQGLSDVRKLLGWTHDRDNKGYSSLADYVDKHGGASRNSYTTLNNALEGRHKAEFSPVTVEKLANIILIPGTNEYYGATNEGLSLFMAIYEGWGLDGIPPHLEDRVKCKTDRAYAEMSVEELQLERDKIDAEIERKAIDLDGIKPRNTILAAFLDVQCERRGITRTALADQTIGVVLFAQLIDGTETLLEKSIESLADAIGVPASMLLILRDSSGVNNVGTDISQ
jgi:hypothetical protein